MGVASPADVERFSSRPRCDTLLHVRPARTLALASLAALVTIAAVLSARHASAQATIPLLPDATEAPAPFAALLHAIPNATTIRIRDGWMGLSPIAPLNHRYEFRREGNDFHGSGTCSAARQEHAIASVAFPVASVAPMLARLARVSVGQGPYRPLITHTDDYPDTVIEIETPAGTVTFTTRSQGRFAGPWEISLASGARGVVSASVPGELASALLERVDANRCAEWTRTLRTR
jgi:hypothetical protein